MLFRTIHGQSPRLNLVGTPNAKLPQTGRKHMKKTLLAMALVGALGLTSGCEKGDAERAGEKIDRNAEKVRDKVEDAGKTAGDKLEKAGDKIEDAARDVKRDVKDATK